MMEFTYRLIQTESEYSACVQLQRDTWGASDVVPVNLLRAAQKGGGVVAGAFDASDSLCATVFGLPAVRLGRLVHWSHMLAVVPNARGTGIGRRLKHFQYTQVRAMGVDTMCWTFDPLESVNAHFNVNRLGAEPIEYVRDMYGEGADNLLHQGLGTDRFVVAWDLTAPEPPERGGESLVGVHESPILNDAERGSDEPIAVPGSTVLIEIPENVQGLKRTDPDRARAWRLSTRAAFERGFESGYRVRGFVQSEGRCFYVLVHES